MKQFRVDVDFRVTKCIYVDAETAEQAEQIVEQRCKDNPYQYTNNPDACTDYSICDVNECEPESLVQKAVRYVVDNLDEDDLAILHAEMRQCYKAHIIPDRNTMDCDRVVDLLDEFGQENDLPEEWWESECEFSDILAEI